MTVIERVQAIIDDLDTGCSAEQTRNDAEALYWDLDTNTA